MTTLKGTRTSQYNVMLPLDLFPSFIITHVLLFQDSAVPFSDPIQPQILHYEAAYWLKLVFIQAISLEAYFLSNDQI